MPERAETRPEAAGGGRLEGHRARVFLSRSWPALDLSGRPPFRLSRLRPENFHRFPLRLFPDPNFYNKRPFKSHQRRETGRSGLGGRSASREAGGGGTGWRRRPGRERGDVPDEREVLCPGHMPSTRCPVPCRVGFPTSAVHPCRRLRSVSPPVESLLNSPLSSWSDSQPPQGQNHL